MTEIKKSTEAVSHKEFAVLFAAIEKINHRLDKLESADQKGLQLSPNLHPSQERFEVAEAIANAIFDGVKEEKACTFEPNAKPCDHCSMCSARGF